MSARGVNIDIIQRQLGYLKGKMREYQHTETDKILRFIALNFVFGFCYACGFFSVNALLISRVGTSSLFYVYLGSAFFAILTAAFAFFSTKTTSAKTIQFSFVFSGLLIVGSWGLLGLENTPAWIYIGVRCLAYAIVIKTSLNFWQLAGRYFTNLEARQYFPHIVAAEIIGIMVGGLFTEIAAPFLHTVNLILIWGITLMFAPRFLLSNTKEPTLRVEAEATHQHNPGVDGPPSTTHASLPTLSMLVTLLFVYWFAHSFFSYGIDYIFNGIAVEAIPEEDKLTAFFGRVTLISSVAVLIYQVFISPRMIVKYGVTFIVWTIPIFLALSCALYTFFPSLLTASIAYGVIYFFVESLALAGLNTLMTVFPEDRLDRIRAVTEGLGRPVGILLLVIIGFLYALRPSVEQITLILLVTATLFLLYPIIFQKTYIRYLLDCLCSHDHKLMLNAIQALGERNKHQAVDPLLSLLKETKTVEVKKTILLSLGRIQSRKALQDIVEIFRTSNWGVQGEVVRALSDYGNYESMFVLLKLIKHTEGVPIETRLNAGMLLTKLLGKRMLPYLMDMLLDDDLRIQTNAIEAIGTMKQRRLIPIIMQFLQHYNHRIRANAAIALYPFRFSSFHVRERALETIDELYQSGQGKSYRAALYAIGVLKIKKYEKTFVELLETTNDKEELRWIAIGLARMKNLAFLNPFIQLLLDDDSAFAISMGKRLLDIPAYSRAMLFNKIETLPGEQQALISHRLDDSWESVVL